MLRLLEMLAFTFWDSIRRIVGLVFPFFSTAQEYRKIGKVVRWILHIVLLIVILAVLTFLNFYLGLDALIGGSWKFLKFFYLPLLFILVYTLAWLGWWLVKLLAPEEEEIAFPDIEEAWEEGIAALNQAGIAITDVPLFLVIGKPVGGEAAMFDAAQLNLIVKNEPPKPNAPLRMFANKDALFITCAGASLLGRQAAKLLDEETSAGAGGFSPGGGAADDPFKTMDPKKAGVQEIVQILRAARDQGREPHELTEDERARIAELQKTDPSQGQRKREPSYDLSKQTQEVELHTARFKYLCRLIARDRRPYCPINGMMVLIPFAAADSDVDANQTTTLCQIELRVAQEVLQTTCPIFGLVSDLEKAPGFPEFIGRFPKDQRQRRVGQRFPLIPDLDPAQTPEKIDSSVQWIGSAVFPNWIYKLFRIESPGYEEMEEAVHGNSRLYALLNEMRERKARFGRVVTRGLNSDRGGSFLYGGCYVAGTGREAGKEQAFVAGVFRRLLENQNFVSWTAEALDQDAKNQGRTQLGYIGIAIGFLVAVGLSAALLYFKTG